MKIRAILLNERPVGCSVGDGTRMDTDWTRIFLGKYYKFVSNPCTIRSAFRSVIGERIMRILRIGADFLDRIYRILRFTEFKKLPKSCKS